MSRSIQIKELSLSELKHYSHKLAERVEESGFIPQHILYVERAGLLIGVEMADHFKCSISGINASRYGGGTKSQLKIVLRYLPRFITHFLRRIEMNSNVHGVKSERNISYEDGAPPKGKAILLVDDAIDTGNSVQEILKFLKSAGYETEKIKVAVLTTTHPDPIRKADITLFDQIACAYPWSYDSREYTKAWQLYDKKKEQLWRKQKT